MVKPVAMLAIGAAALAAGLCFDVPRGEASYYGDAPWCVMTFGDDVHWDCHYRAGEECVAAASGRRGQCNVNPYYSGPSAPAGAPKRGGRSTG